MISTGEYQYLPRLSPRSIMVFSSGYHIIFNESISPRSILVFSNVYIEFIHSPILNMGFINLER